MKTISFFILALCFLSFSCEKEVIPLKGSDSAFSVRKIDFSEITIYNIGDYHNQQLDLAYRDLKFLVENKGVNNESLREVVIKNSLGEIDNSIPEKIELEKFVNWFYSEKWIGREEKERQGEIIEILSDSKKYSISLKEFFEITFLSIESIVDLEAKDKLCQDLLNLATQTLNGQEWEFAIASINVYSSSVDYWSEKMADWAALGNGQVYPSFGPLAQADLAGAVAGGLYGSLGGTVVLPVLGTVSGWVSGAISGGCIASISTGVGMILSRWF